MPNTKVPGRFGAIARPIGYVLLTAVLIGSLFTMAWALTSDETGDPPRSVEIASSTSLVDSATLQSQLEGMELRGS